MLLRQLVYADKILINKIDLVPEGAERDTAVAFIKNCIDSVNSSAQVDLTQYSKIDLDDLITLGDKKPKVPLSKELVHQLDEESLSKVHKLQH